MSVPARVQGAPGTRIAFEQAATPRLEAVGRSPAPLRVVVVDPSALMRCGIEAMLAQVDRVEVVAACSEPTRLRRLMFEARPDAVVLDIGMPRARPGELLQLVRALRARHPGLGIVALGMPADCHAALELLERGRGGHAYLLKEELRDGAELGRAIEAVARGESVVAPCVVDAMIDAHARKPSPLDELTPRELEVLSRIAEGASNCAIASSLVLSKRAVEKHVNAIFAKLDLSDPEHVSRRVKAALIYLAEAGAPSTAPERSPPPGWSLASS